MYEPEDYISRFFCEFDKRRSVSLENLVIHRQLGLEPLLSDSGEAEYPHSWDTYDGVPSIVLLGPPRTGKTTEFEVQCNRVPNGFLIELRNVLDPDCLESAWSLETKSRWDIFLGSEGKGELFLDSLDEGKLEIRQLAGKIIRWLESLGSDVLSRLRVHVSCRENDWKRIDEQAWSRIALKHTDAKQDKGDRNFVKLALLPLDSGSVSTYLQANGINALEFYDVLPAQVTSLIGWPQGLRMVVEVFSSSELLDADINHLYQKVIENRIQETNQVRASLGTISLSQKINSARLIAGISILSGREVIALQEVDTETEVDAGLCGKDSVIVREVFSSDLFETYQEGKFRFEDRYIAAHLAADWLSSALNKHNMSVSVLMQMFYAEPSDETVIPALRSLAGWMAAKNSEVRRTLIDRSSYLLLSDDYPGELAIDAKLQLWEWMKYTYAERDWFDDTELIANAGKLVCDPIISDIENVLLDRVGFGRDLRIFSLEILKKGKARAHEELLIRLVIDEGDDTVLKCRAIRALSEIAPELVPKLKPILLSPPADDPQLEVLGNVLNALFPSDLSIEEIIEQLWRTTPALYYGAFRLFVRRVAVELTQDSRAKVLDVLCSGLTEILYRRKSGQGQQLDRRRTFVPAYEYDSFLIEQLEAWGEKPDKYMQIEKWLSVLSEANAYGLVAGSDVEAICEYIKTHQDCRRQCGVIRIDHLFNKYGESFKPHRVHLHDRLYSPKKEDLHFWMNTLEDWHNQPEAKLDAAWQEFTNCWSQSGWCSEAVDWVESVAERHPGIAKLWEREKFISIDAESMRWRWEATARKRKKADEKRRWSKALLSNLGKIKSGDENWLVDIVYGPYFEEREASSVEGWLEEQMGTDASHAFKDGLLAYWEESDFPDPKQYIGNSIPWWSMLVQLAVERWVETGAQWSDIGEDLRQKAIRAALWSCNDPPSWFFDVVRVEGQWALSFCLHVMSLEDVSDRVLLRLPHLFSGHSNEDFVQKIAVEFLTNRPLTRMLTAKVLLRLIFSSEVELNPDDSLLDSLWQLAIAKYEEGNIDSSLLFASAVFRYRQADVLQWLDKNYLIGEERNKRFERWLASIKEIHLRFDFERHWPVWMEDESVAAMIPDMYAAYPPEGDPGIEGYNRGQYRRGDLGRLRDNALHYLADGGSEFAGRALSELLKHPQLVPRKNLILHYIDIWKTKRSQNTWHPLCPEDVISIHKERAEPIRSPEELFAFTCKVLDKIRDEIEKGEDSIKTLLWNEDNRKPKKESEFQKLTHNKLKDVIRYWGQRIVSGRELEIAGNFPDIFLTCILPTGIRARVLIEMKRQQYYEKRKGEAPSDVISAISAQLVGKYLVDPETRHGIYLVGWYGKDFYGAYKTKLKAQNSGKLPATPKEFEQVLQSIADQIARESPSVDEVKVYVMDLAVQK